jgi:hypothetical protein
MGNTVTKSECINLEGQEITKDSYTIKRTSGEMETKWITGSGCGSPDWVTQNAIKRDGEWRIYMNNGQDDINTVVQGWRRLPTIYPTRLEGAEGDIKEWQRTTGFLLDKLEEARLQAELTTKEASSTPPQLEEEAKDNHPYHHRVETCPCGICDTARYHKETWKSSK